jgi:hypothetical protein
VNSVDENRANFCKALDGKPLFSAVYIMYMVTLNKLKAILKVSAQAGQSGAVNKTSVELIAQDDDFQELKRHKRNIYKDTTQTAKNLNESVPTSAAGRLPPKAVLTHNFFTSLRTTDMHTETTGAGRFQIIRWAITSTDEFYHKHHLTPTRLQSQRRIRVLKYMKRNPYHNKRIGELFGHEIIL